MGKFWDDGRKIMVTDSMIKQETNDRRVERWRDRVPSDGTATRPSAPPSRLPSCTESTTTISFPTTPPSNSPSAPSGSVTSAVPTADTLVVSLGNVSPPPTVPRIPCYISDISQTEVDEESVAGDESRELIELQSAESRTAQRVLAGQSARATVLGTAPDGSTTNDTGRPTTQVPATPERPPRRSCPVPPPRHLHRKPRDADTVVSPTPGAANATNSSKVPTAPRSGFVDVHGVIAGEAPPLEVLRRATFVPMPGLFRGSGTPGHLMLPATPPARPPRSPSRPLGPRRQPELRIITGLPTQTRSSSSGSHKRRASEESEGKESKRSRSSKE